MTDDILLVEINCERLIYYYEDYLETREDITHFWRDDSERTPELLEEFATVKARSKKAKEELYIEIRKEAIKKLGDVYVPGKQYKVNYPYDHHPSRAGWMMCKTEILVI